MDVAYIESFVDRWIVKAQAYRSENLEDLFDRFFTLFVAYNRLYSAVAELHREALNQRALAMYLGDRREATVLMAKVIGQPSLDTEIESKPAIAYACGALTLLLRNNHFYLHTVRGTNRADHLRDEKLAAGLSEHRLLSILECLYQIRCNIFHGEKQFASQQAELLSPALVLLEAVVSLSKRALHVFAHRARR